MDGPELITDKRLAKVANRSGGYIFLIFVSLATAVDYFSGYFDDAPAHVVVLLILAALVLTMAQRFGQIDFDNHRFLALFLVYLVYFVAIGLILPFGAAYLFIGVHLVYLAGYAYGKWGAMIGTLLLAAVISLSYILSNDIVSQTDYPILVRTISVFFILSYHGYHSVHVTRSEIRELKKTGKKLKTEQQRLLALINNMGDAVISTDTNGKIQSYNGAALDILDTNETLSNQSLEDFVKLSDGDGKDINILDVMRKLTQNVQRRDLLHTYSDGEKINLYLNITPVKVGYGEDSQSGYTIIMRDISKEKSLEEERDEFISVVSHELRTPVTVTEGKISNALLHNKRSVKNRKMKTILEDAHRQSIYLADMINDLATLARAERTSFDDDLAVVEPDKLLKELKDSYEIEAKQKGLKIKTNCPKTIPKIKSSRLYIKEILQNFITNAIKYSRTGSIVISVKKSGRGVAFSVKDTGIGISKSDQRHLFEKFFRSEDYRTRESSGTGLGLYVAAKLAKKIDGQIKVSSIKNKGSTFSLTVHSLAKRKSRRKAD
ncbi:MAG: ATP-binding protein [Candidatus Saccharimonadales bacterium]|nr:ATP-binding protein [Candidatus Saccharimonadales bacterium]